MTAPATNTALTLVQQYPPERYNLLLPATEMADITQWHRLSVSIVNISPDPRRGDVYEVSSRAKETSEGQLVKVNGKTVYEALYALARPAKDRIGTAAGISYDTAETKILKVTSDYVLHQTVGGIMRPDGSWVAFKSSKEIDLAVIDMELREAATKKLIGGMYGNEADRAKQLYRGAWGPDPANEKWQRFWIDPADMGRAIDDLVRPQLIQWRKNKTMRAETGSRGRIITHLLGIPTHFSAEELRLPFVIPRIDFTPPLDDPEVKRALINKAAESHSSLYGGRGSASGVIIPRDAIRDLGSDNDIDAEFRVVPEESASTPYTVQRPAQPEPPSAPAPIPQFDPVAAAQEVLERHEGAAERAVSGGLGLPARPAAAQGQTDPAAQPQSEQNSGNACEYAGCGKKISEGIVAFSKGKFEGKVYCMNCQKKAGVAK